MFDTTQLKRSSTTPRAPASSARTTASTSSSAASASGSWPGPRRPAAASRWSSTRSRRGRSAAPLHMHTREDEYSYVLEGRMGALLGDDVVYAEPGDFVFKPRDQWHTFWNAGDEPCRILEIIAPGARSSTCSRDGRADAPAGPAELRRLHASGTGSSSTPRVDRIARSPSASGLQCRTTGSARIEACLQLGEDRLGLEVGVEVGVALLAADARRLVAAERRRRVAAAPGVDVDVARLQQRRRACGPARCRGSTGRRPGRTRCRWRARRPPRGPRTASPPAPGRRSPRGRSSCRRRRR